MADALASILAGNYSSLPGLLSGQNPLAPEQVPGYLGAQMVNGMNDTSGSTGGLLGAIANGLRGAVGSSMLKRAVNNTTNAGMAAQPDLLSAYASPQGAVNYAAQNPGMNKFALAQILAQGNPTAGQGEGMSAIALMRARLRNDLSPQTGQPIPGAPLLGGSVMGAGTAGAGTMVPGVRGTGSLAPVAFPQGYNGRAQPAMGGQMQQVLTQLSTATTPQERAVILQRLPADQIQALRAQLAGAGNAAQP